MTTKPWIMKEATVFVLDDPAIGGQCLLAVSRERAFFLPAPGGNVVSLELPALKKHMDDNKAMFGHTADVILTAIAEHQREPS